MQIALGEFGAMMAVYELLRANNKAKEQEQEQGLFMNTTVNVTLFDRYEYVGFTSWREYQKADFKQGVSIDWTKIDLSRKRNRHRHIPHNLQSKSVNISQQSRPSIYFWYGYYSEKGFYETTESYHAGLVRVMESCLDFKLPSLGPGYYFYGNYFITDRTTFLSYMESAMQVNRPIYAIL
jgi:hypothetical protein